MSYDVTRSEGPPYQCEVKVGGVRYGSGGGANKKIAKLSAGGSLVSSTVWGWKSTRLSLHVTCSQPDSGAVSSRSLL